MKYHQQERILCNKCMIKTVVLLCVKEAIKWKQERCLTLQDI